MVVLQEILQLPLEVLPSRKLCLHEVTRQLRLPGAGVAPAEAHEVKGHDEQEDPGGSRGGRQGLAEVTAQVTWRCTSFQGAKDPVFV